jgi:hypothetical protein
MQPGLFDLRGADWESILTRERPKSSAQNSQNAAGARRPMSSSAHADDPVSTVIAAVTGCSAFAEHDKLRMIAVGKNASDAAFSSSPRNPAKSPA